MVIVMNRESEDFLEELYEQIQNDKEQSGNKKKNKALENASDPPNPQATNG